jgi:integrase
VLNPIVFALRFFYGATLGQAELLERIAHAREPLKLPLVLSADEEVCFLEVVAGPKHRAALAIAYAAGLRPSEVASLTVAEIDHSRMVIRAKQGKDRYVMLSAQLLTILAPASGLARRAGGTLPGRGQKPGASRGTRAPCLTGQLTRSETNRQMADGMKPAWELEQEARAIRQPVAGAMTVI